MLTSEQIEEFRTKYKRIAHVVGTDNAWEVVLRKPTRAEFKRYKGLLHGEGKAAACEWMAIATCVHPASPEAFEALLEDYPAIPEACSPKIALIVGLSVDEATKS